SRALSYRRPSGPCPGAGTVAGPFVVRSGPLVVGAVSFAVLIGPPCCPKRSAFVVPGGPFLTPSHPPFVLPSHPPSSQAALFLSSRAEGEGSALPPILADPPQPSQPSSSAAARLARTTAGVL